MDFLQASARILAGILQTLAIRPNWRPGAILGRFPGKNGAPEGRKFAFLTGLGYDVICELWNPGAVAAYLIPLRGTELCLFQDLGVTPQDVRAELWQIGIVTSNQEPQDLVRNRRRCSTARTTPG